MRTDATLQPGKRPLSFGAVLKRYRKEANLSQKELAERMNVTRNTVINWEADRSRPDYDCVPALCSALNLPLHELFGLEKEWALSPVEGRLLRNFRQLTPASRRGIDRMVSALLEEEAAEKDRKLRENYRLFISRPGAAAAGTGVETQEVKPSYTFLRKSSLNARADGLVRVSGESMEPVYHDGDWVYYREAACALPGEDVIADTDDGTVIKRLNRDGTLYSVNPALPYPEKTADNTLVIRGVVLGSVYASDYPAKDDSRLIEELFADEIREFREKYGLDEWA